MKTKTLLLAGLSAILLAGCGGQKSYKTEVKMETFLSSLEKLEETSPLLDKNPYSFTLESKEEGGYEIIYMQNKDEISKAVKEDKSEGECKFDVINSVFSIKSSGEEKYKNPSLETKSEFDYNRVTQKDAKNIYQVDKKAETYTKDEQSDSEKAVAQYAMSAGLRFINSFKTNVTLIGKDGKYYIDGDTYTVVLEKTDENTSRTKYTKTICQLTAKDDGYEYYYSDLTEITELHRKDIDKEVTYAKFSKKSVNLDPIDLHEYLEVEELDFPEI